MALNPGTHNTVAPPKILNSSKGKIQTVKSSAYCFLALIMFLHIKKLLVYNRDIQVLFYAFKNQDAAAARILEDI